MERLCGSLRKVCWNCYEIEVSTITFRQQV
jgi:hypothetical protein